MYYSYYSNRYKYKIIVNIKPNIDKIIKNVSSEQCYDEYKAINKKFPRNEFPIVKPIFYNNAALSPYYLHKSVANPSIAISWIPKNKHKMNPNIHKIW